MGAIEGKSGDWVGVALKKENGKNSGNYNGKTYFECEPKHGIFVRATDCQYFDAETKAAATIQSLERMRSAKKKVKNEINSRTWNALDNRNEQLQLERGKKVRAEMGAPAIPAGKSKRRESLKEMGMFENFLFVFNCFYKMGEMPVFVM
jgi:dynactin complex subunit